ncbi:hypothetical protein V5N11_006664 [Cardamine amara subsp. amara]|uniref:Uncharacterized protein n=1 Tax=Cardamine amara subsp. amara TaxID=228776 RepID=A0ABD1B8C5_CARAN
MGDYLLLSVIGMILAFSSLVSSDQLLVVGETKELQVTPSLVVKVKSLNQDLTTLCERIHIRRFSRFNHIHKYAHSLKLIVNASTGGNTSNIHVCFHRDLSIAVGMCPHDQWEKISNGSWIQTMSPFDHKILDVRITSSSKVTLKMSTVEEWFMYRILFFILGSILLSSATTLSTSLTFYSISTLVLGIIFLAMILLIQVLKCLPTGQSSSALFLHSSVVGFGGFIFRYIPGLYQGLLILMGFDQGIPEPLVYFVLVPNLHIMGVFLGSIAVKELVLTEDDSIDTSTSLFVSWSTWIFGSVLILQSSVDLLLGGGALIVVIVMSSRLKKNTRFMTFLVRVHENLMNLLLGIWKKIRDAIGPIVPGFISEFGVKVNFVFFHQKPDEWKFKGSRRVMCV